MGIYIRSSATVGIQPDLNVPGKMAFPAKLEEPDYKEFIGGAPLRRMSRSIKMGVWSAMKCTVEGTEPIIVGTGLGCLADSERFLNSLEYERPEGASSVVSPTPFIQSTHNTIGGQIALLTGDRAYNCTHVQNGHSFEAALIDAMMMTQRSDTPVLVGAVEEKIDLLDHIANGVGLPAEIRDKFAEGASFFRISEETSPVEIASCTVKYGVELSKVLDHTLEGMDLLLVGESGPADHLAPGHLDVPVVKYSDLCGLYMTNVAFGMDLAYRVLTGRSKIENIQNDRINSICIVNSYLGGSFGIIKLVRT